MLNFFNIELGLILSDCFNEKLIIEGTEYKLATFATITVSFFLNQMDVIINIKWFENVNIGDSWKNFSKNLNRISCYFIFKWSESSKLVLNEKILSVSHSSQHIFISDSLIQSEDVFLTKAKLRDSPWSLYFILVFCKADQNTRKKRYYLRTFNWLDKASQPQLLVLH